MFSISILKDPVSSPHLNPKIYHEINWEVNTNTQTPHGPKCGTLWLDLDYEVCMKTTMAQVRIGLFSSQSPLGTPLTFDGYENEDPPEGINGYQRPCSGDSGSGHWITENERAIVVAIHQGGEKPCGLPLWGASTRYAGSKQMKLTNHVIHAWIKEKADI